MKPRQLIIWVAIAAVVVGVGILVTRPAATFKSVDNAGFQKAIADGALLVDVRSPAEYALGYISGAENVEVSSIAQAAPAWDKDRAVAVYCASGSRSLTAAQTLQSMGFRQVYNLKEGIAGWGAAGLPVVTSNAGSQNGSSGGSGTATAPSGPASGGTSSPGAVKDKPTLIEFYTDG
jgi:rhodanese-related sulfurtransferase